MKRGTLNLLASLLFLFMAAGAYYYLWNNTKTMAPPVVTATTYPPIDISSIKGQADTLVRARENNAGLPIPTPTEKLGKSNPFNNPE